MSTQYFGTLARAGIVQALAVETNARLSFYTGTLPTDTPSNLSSYTLLATISIANNSWSPGAFDTELSIGPISGTILATGTCGWARYWQQLTGSSPVYFDCDVTVTGGGGTVELSSLNFVAAHQVIVTSFTLTAPTQNCV